MALRDVTDRQAVLDAISEFDRLGRDEFLEKYGFGRATAYFIELDGKSYDSKAIIGAAHGFQHGTAMGHDEFSGGDATVASRLSALGFVVTRPGPGWTMPLGTVTTRSEIKAEYGGTIFGGIEPSRTSPNILIYTDPSAGEANGYNYDGWDESDDRVFYYTGEGRRGDQELREGNKAVLEHASTGRTLRLFESIDSRRRPGGKRQRYVGAFRVDDSSPYRREPAPDVDERPRKVLVFRLLRDDVVAPVALPRAEEPTRRTEPLRGQHGDSPAPPIESPEDYLAQGASAEIELVASEQNVVTSYETVPRAGSIATREEAKLVSHFEAWLRGQGHQVMRVRINIPGEKHTLVTDPFDVTAGTLYEAKSGTDRATIRLGIGQLLDYLRFVPSASGALLLPSEPSDDLKSLIHTCGLGMAYKELGGWVLS